MIHFVLFLDVYRLFMEKLNVVLQAQWINEDKILTEPNWIAPYKILKSGKSKLSKNAVILCADLQQSLPCPTLKH